MQDSAFLGRGWRFPPRFDKTPKGIRLQMVDKDQDIQESLKILFSTQKGERLIDENYGCDLHKIQFEVLTESKRTGTIEDVSKAILLYEPRISLLNVKVETVSFEDLGCRMNIHLDYIIRATNSRSNMVYPFYSIEGNNV